MRKWASWGCLILTPVLLVLALAIPMLIFGRYRGGELAKPTGTSGIGAGCFVSDAAFTDLSAVADVNALVTKLGERYPNAKQNADYVRQTIEKGKQVGINPLVPLAIWAGEQGFASPHKAFGWGYKDSGTMNGVDRWEVQLEQVYKTIRRAMDSEGLYATPKGTNTFTRLFFHYTTAMKYVYEHNGNSWKEDGKYTDGSQPVKNRLAVFRLLAPNQIECDQTTLLAGNTIIQGDGKSTCANVIQKPLSRQGAHQGSLGAPRVIILHYLAYRGSSTSEYLTVDQAHNYFNNSPKYVQYVIGRDGRIYQFAPENRAAAGAQDYNRVAGDYGSNAIAVQIENEGHFQDRREEFQETDAQVAANVALIQCLATKYQIPITNGDILRRNSQAKEPYNVISHLEADARGGADKGKRGSRRSDPGERFMRKVLNRLQAN